MEYNFKIFNTFYKQSGIVKQTTTSDTPEQNSVTKRKNRTLVENVRCMLQHMKLNHRFWAKTMVTTRYIHNKIFTKTISNMTLGKV